MAGLGGSAVSGAPKEKDGAGAAGLVAWGCAGAPKLNGLAAAGAGAGAGAEASFFGSLGETAEAPKLKVAFGAACSCCGPGAAGAPAREAPKLKAGLGASSFLPSTAAGAGTASCVEADGAAPKLKEGFGAALSAAGFGASSGFAGGSAGLLPKENDAAGAAGLSAGASVAAGDFASALPSPPKKLGTATFDELASALGAGAAARAGTCLSDVQSFGHTRCEPLGLTAVFASVGAPSPKSDSLIFAASPPFCFFASGSLFASTALTSSSPPSMMLAFLRLSRSARAACSSSTSRFA